MITDISSQTRSSTISSSKELCEMYSQSWNSRWSSSVSTIFLLSFSLGSKPSLLSQRKAMSLLEGALGGFEHSRFAQSTAVK
jgi:hypothetical protein